MSSIAYTHSGVAAQWHPTRNGLLKLSDVTEGSNKVIWWLCPNKCIQGCLHEWEAKVSNRCYLNRGCPYCAKQKICIHNSFRHTHPDIAAQWHPTKNGDKVPGNYSSGSNVKVWWICSTNNCSNSCLHEWEAVIANRCKDKSKTGCPYCSGRTVCKCNSIIFTHPAISAQWHPTLNGNKIPDNYSPGSNVKVWWICPITCSDGCSHIWDSTINTRVAGSNCPYCSYPSQKVCIHNSILYTHPNIATQWHPTKNGELLPSELGAGSGKKAWFLCLKIPKHEWEADIHNRCSRNHGCPHCVNKTEAKLLDYLKARFPDVQSQFRQDWCRNSKTDRMLPFDFFIPSLNLIIELDGPQHFRQISNWNCYKKTMTNDAFKMNCAFGQGLSVMRLVQEEILAATDQWLDEHLLPNLVKSEEPSFIIVTAKENIYDELEKLLDEDIVLSAEDDEED